MQMKWIENDLQNLCDKIRDGKKYESETGLIQ